MEQVRGGSIDSLVNMVEHPVKTLGGIGHVIAHPMESVKVVGHAVKETASALLSGDGRAISRSAGTVGMLFVPLADDISQKTHSAYSRGRIERTGMLVGFQPANHLEKVILDARAGRLPMKVFAGTLLGSAECLCRSIENACPH